MAQVTITINSREYAIACGDGQEAHILKLARLLDEKAKLLTKNLGQINENMLLVMTALLFADELEDAKKGIVPQVVAEPQIVEKVVEKIVEVAKPVEVEKVVEKIIEVEKIVSDTPNIENLDNELSLNLEQLISSLKAILEEIKKI